MFTRDSFIYAMEKAAGFEPEYRPDNYRAANEEHEASRGDARSELKGLFDQAGPTGKADTSLVNRLFPGKGKDRQTSNPLIKVAQSSEVAEAFSRMSTGEGQHYNQVLLRGFRDEFEKIAMMEKDEAFVGTQGKLLTSALAGAMKKAKPVAAAAQTALR